MALTNEQKNCIKKVQETTADIVAEALKVKNLSLIEDSILKNILESLSKRRVSPFDECIDTVMREHLVACVILYKHLSEKTID